MGMTPEEKEYARVTRVAVDELVAKMEGAEHRITQAHEAIAEIKERVTQAHEAIAEIKTKEAGAGLKRGDNVTLN